MHPRRIRMNWSALILAAGFCVFAGYQSLAMRTLAQLKPAVIAIVDLETVFNNLEEGRDADRKLQDLANRLEAERASKAAAIEKLQEELEVWPAASDRHQETLNKLTLASTEYQTFVEFSRWRIDAERAMALNRIYTSVRRAALEEAESRGYDVVLVNDSLGQIPPGDEMETTRQISARRMLYTNPALDITQDLIARMNAGQAAGRRTE